MDKLHRASCVSGGGGGGGCLSRYGRASMRGRLCKCLCLFSSSSTLCVWFDLPCLSVFVCLPALRVKVTVIKRDTRILF